MSKDTCNPLWGSIILMNHDSTGGQRDSGQRFEVNMQLWPDVINMHTGGGYEVWGMHDLRSIWLKCLIQPSEWDVEDIWSVKLMIIFWVLQVWILGEAIQPSNCPVG